MAKFCSFCTCLPKELNCVLKRITPCIEKGKSSIVLCHKLVIIWTVLTLPVKTADRFKRPAVMCISSNCPATELDAFPRKDDNWRSYFDFAPQLGDIAVAHAVAATRGRFADRTRTVGTVDTVQ
jgi:hypothetical protein